MCLFIWLVRGYGVTMSNGIGEIVTFDAIRSRSFYITNREGMELLGGEEQLHYLWMEAMKE